MPIIRPANYGVSTRQGIHNFALTGESRDRETAPQCLSLRGHIRRHAKISLGALEINAKTGQQIVKNQYHTIFRAQLTHTFQVTWLWQAAEIIDHGRLIITAAISSPCRLKSFSSACKSFHSIIKIWLKACGWRLSVFVNWELILFSSSSMTG